MIDWATLNMAAFVLALYCLGSSSLAGVRPVADILMINWAVGAGLWAFGKAVPLPFWIANDAISAFLLLRFVSGRAAVIAGVAFIPIIAGNGAALLASVNADLWINGAGWVQLACIALGAGGNGMGQRWKGSDRAGDRNHAGRFGSVGTVAMAGKQEAS